MELKTQKPFEVPDAGLFLGTIIDVVDLPQQKTMFNGIVTFKDRLRIMWVLTKTDNTPALDSEGKPFRIVQSYNASLHEKSALFAIVRQILNAAPPLLQKSEDLAALLIGRSSQIFITKDPDRNNPQKFYANVKGLSPLSPGQVPPPIPQGFVRHKDRPQTTAGPNGQPVQTYAQPAAQTAPQPVAQTAPQPVTGVAVGPAPTPTPNQNTSF